MAFETAGCEMLSRFAALPMLLVSITAIRMSRSRNLSRRLVRSFQGMSHLISKGYDIMQNQYYSGMRFEGSLSPIAGTRAQIAMAQGRQRAADEEVTMNRRAFLTGAAALGF